MTEEKRLKMIGIDDWTMTVNKIVNILKCELDGGFLEDTKKYDNAGEELIYSCLRAIASQILSIPELAIVDREARLPDKPNPITAKEHNAQIDMLEAGYVKEIK